MYPTLEFEHSLLQTGYKRIAGADEAGRGSLFGPVCVGIVILPSSDYETVATALHQVRDSKQLPREKVYKLAPIVKEAALNWAVGEASAQEIDQYGIVGGIRLGLERALSGFPASPDFILGDYSLPVERLSLPYKTLKKGDARCLSIACGAILAKYHHDVAVRALAQKYAPDYALERNVGYGTVAHRNALKRLGPTPDHRHSFRPIIQPRLFD